MNNSNKSAKKLGLLLLVSFFFLFGWWSGYRGYRLLLSFRSIKVINRTPPLGINKELDLALFWQVLDSLENKYYRFVEVDADELLYGAISGLVERVGDPYTAFFTPQENSEFRSSLSGTYEGIGARLGFSDRQLVIIAPLKNSPAEKAGIRGGDLVLAVDGESTQDWSLAEAVARIRGEKNTQVELNILRKSADKTESSSFSVKVTRGEIPLPSMELSWKEDGIAYLELYRFGDDFNKVWRQTVDELIRQNPKGLIIDVRNNPGGYLDGSISLTGDFFQSGDLLWKQGEGGKVEKVRVEKPGRLAEIRLVVLINEGSASASEIFAGAIQVRERGLLVGEKSFGKGTVQEAIDFAGGSGLHVTIADWLLPDGQSIEGAGLIPDIRIVLSEEDIQTGRDPQLDKALELLK